MFHQTRIRALFQILSLTVLAQVALWGLDVSPELAALGVGLVTVALPFLSPGARALYNRAFRREYPA